MKAHQLPLFRSRACLRDALSEEEARFADAYLGALEGVPPFSLADAYIAVRPGANRGTARKVGGDWLKKRDELRAYIEAETDWMAEQAELTKAEVIGIYRRAAEVGLGRRKIRKTVLGKDGRPVGDVEVFEPSPSVAVAAAHGLAKFLGIDDGSAQSVTLTFDLTGQSKRAGADG